jgi:hypothetical protein
MPSPPASVTRSAVSSIVSGRFISDRCVRVVRPVAYTVAPRRPNSTAMARPAARDAPATSATLPFSSSMVTTVPVKPDTYWQVLASGPRLPAYGWAPTVMGR